MSCTDEDSWEGRRSHLGSAVPKRLQRKIFGVWADGCRIVAQGVAKVTQPRRPLLRSTWAWCCRRRRGGGLATTGSWRGTHTIRAVLTVGDEDVGRLDVGVNKTALRNESLVMEMWVLFGRAEMGQQFQAKSHPTSAEKVSPAILRTTASRAFSASEPKLE